MSDSIEYRAGYKYQLAERYEIQTSIKTGRHLRSKLIDMYPDGLLVIHAGYAWDGPSGPVFDGPEVMRASLVHDALYQLMREKKLDSWTYRDKADGLFRDLCIADGVTSALAFVYYAGLRALGGPAASPANKREILTAPLPE